MTAPDASAPEFGHSYHHDAPRQLRRSARDRVVAGVCGGLGQYFGVDPALLRIAFVALSLAGGSGALVYIIAWIVMPEAPADEDVPVAAGHRFGAPQAAIGAVLVLLGACCLPDSSCRGSTASSGRCCSWAWGPPCS